MKWFHAVKIDKDSQCPVYKQLGDGLNTLIEDGALKPGQKLPPIRKMADALCVNNVTIINAYKYLENKNIVQSLMGSGTYVSKIFGENEVPYSEEPYFENLHKNANHQNIFFDFTSNKSELDFFPIEDFKIFSSETLDKYGGTAFESIPQGGLLSLRKTFAQYIKSYGINIIWENVTIFDYLHDCTDTIFKIFLNNNRVFIEKPSVFNSRGGAINRKLDIIEIDMEKDGPNMESFETALKSKVPSLFWAMPVYQNPTGICYSTDKMQRLLYLAEKYGFYIIEEDWGNEIYFGEKPPTTLKSLDYCHRVIYLKSFYRAVLPGKTMVFAVLPQREKFDLQKVNLQVINDGYFQRVLREYLPTRKFNKHTVSIKNVLHLRHKEFVYAFENYLWPYFDVHIPDGGFYYWLKIKEKGVSDRELVKILYKLGIIVMPGEIFYTKNQSENHIRLGMLDLTPEQIRTGLLAVKQLYEAYY